MSQVVTDLTNWIILVSAVVGALTAFGTGVMVMYRVFKKKYSQSIASEVTSQLKIPIDTLQSAVNSQGNAISDLRDCFDRNEKTEEKRYEEQKSVVSAIKADMKEKMSDLYETVDVVEQQVHLDRVILERHDITIDHMGVDLEKVKDAIQEHGNFINQHRGKFDDE